jgi:hypothetical protein
MKVFKQLALAFAAGGALALVGQLILMLWAGLLAGANDPMLLALAGPLTLLSMGVLGGVLYLTRVYDVIEKHCGFGAVLPFCGFCIAVAHVVEGTLRATGQTGRSLKAGTMLVVQVVGIGGAGCVLVALLSVAASSSLEPVGAVAASLAAAQAGIAAAAPGSASMFASAFLVGGLLCLLFQAFAMYTKLDVPQVLILGIMLGGLLTPAGMMQSFSTIGGAGLDVMVVGAASVLTGSTVALTAGNPLPFVLLLSVIIALMLFGWLWGAIRAKMPQPEQASE